MLQPLHVFACFVIFGIYTNFEFMHSLHGCGDVACCSNQLYFDNLCYVAMVMIDDVNVDAFLQ